MGSDAMKDEQYYVDIVSAMAERTIKRLWIVILVQILVMVGMVTFYIWHESQYVDVEETVTQEVTQEAETGNNSFVGGDYYGEANNKNDKNG